MDHPLGEEGLIEEKLGPFLRGWVGYFGFCETRSVLKELDSWIRRRLRCILWKQWKTAANRTAELCKRGVRRTLAAQAAGSNSGPWRMAATGTVNAALPNAYFSSLGLPSLAHG